jgi:putative oxidoreductase
MSQKPARSELLAWLARLVLAGVFLAAAAPKLLDPAAFAEAIAKYQVFPDAAVNLIATVVPALELVGALALLTPWRRGGALLLVGLLLGFTVLLAVSLARGLDLSCGCFGAADGARQRRAREPAAPAAQPRPARPRRPGPGRPAPHVR